MFKIDITYYSRKVNWYAIFLDMNVSSLRVTGVANMSYITIIPFSLLFYVHLLLIIEGGHFTVVKLFWLGHKLQKYVVLLYMTTFQFYQKLYDIFMSSGHWRRIFSSSVIGFPNKPQCGLSGSRLIKADPGNSRSLWRQLWELTSWVLRCHHGNGRCGQTPSTGQAMQERKIKSFSQRTMG